MRELYISGVYKIVNSVSNKVYVGSAVNIEKRWLRHLRDLKRGRHPNHKLEEDYNLLGEDSFLIEVIKELPIEELVAAEQQYMDTMSAAYGTGILYNIRTLSQSTLGIRHKEDTKLKISATSAGRWSGRKHSPETKEKMSQSAKALKRNPEVLSRRRIENDEELHSTIEKFEAMGNFLVMDRSIRKGKGSLSKEQMQQIRDLYSMNPKIAYRSIARLYDINKTRVKYILFGDKRPRKGSTNLGTTGLAQ